MERASKGFPGFAQIYWLHDPLASRPLRAALSLEKPSSALRAEVRPEGHVRSG
jgi:hypothetical protein